MSEKVQIVDKTPEKIAYDLMHEVFRVEKRETKDRAYILDTYAECLAAVRGSRRSPGRRQPKSEE